MKKARKKQNICKNEKESIEDYIDSDESFYFIVGHTSGGTQYGITWEEAIEDGLIENNSLSDKNDEDDKIPFRF